VLLNCGEGNDPHFGVIDIASTLNAASGLLRGPIGADATETFSAEVLANRESEWKPLICVVEGQPPQTDEKCPEVLRASLGRPQPEASGLPLCGDP
jgi:hypothetical protein